MDPHYEDSFKQYSLKNPIFRFMIIITGLFLFYSPTRLFLIGNFRTATILSAETKYGETTTRGGINVRYSYQVLKLVGYPGEFLPSYDIKFEANQQVTVLYSDYLRTGIIVEGGTSYLDVVASHAHPIVYLFYLIWLLILFLMIAKNILDLVYYIYVQIHLRWKNSVANAHTSRERVLATTGVLSSIVVACIGLTVTYVLLYLVAKVALYAEKSDLLYAVLIFSGEIMAITTSFPRFLIKKLLQLVEGETIVIRVCRNIVFVFGGIILINKLIEFARGNFYESSSILEMLRELVMFLLGG